MFFSKSIGIIIFKPTKMCNATCSHCSSPPDMKEKITLEKFELFLKKFEKFLHPTVEFIWHGGEPTLMGIDYYYKAYELAKKYILNPKFSLQTNMLIYNKEIYQMYETIFNHRVSTSYEFYTNLRNINGNKEKYYQIWYNNIKAYQQDLKKNKNKENVTVISILNKENIKRAIDIYNLAKKEKFDLRINHIYPAGRAGQPLSNEYINNDEWKNAIYDPNIHITKEEYAKALLDVTKEYFKDIEKLIEQGKKDFINVVPTFQLFLLYMQKYKIEDSGYASNGICPWINDCNGKFLGVEPNGDIYNCAEFADIKEYKFGNFIKDSIENITRNNNAKKLSARRYRLPEDCKKCEYLYACHGGCMREAWLSEGNIYGKTWTCKAWKDNFRFFDSLDKEKRDKIYEFLIG